MTLLTEIASTAAATSLYSAEQLAQAPVRAERALESCYIHDSTPRGLSHAGTRNEEFYFDPEARGKPADQLVFCL